ncbi:hypothetical protein [Bacillus thuringiensis]|uniref:hypothetical protein n=1 Tax=Bacillus thuringiensis TaxID=1428 RepID=UPI0021D6818D|nr:hypothetical protein [Bacillus thuringiensis]MCU7666920.1 hypothetical protein [Bacillus thuringiensis]
MKSSPQKGTPFLEVVVYSLDHQTEDGKNKPVYIRVWEPFISEFQKRLKVKDRVQLPIDRMRENLQINQEGKPVSYLNANFSMFSYLYSGGGNAGNGNGNNGNANNGNNNNRGNNNNAGGNNYNNQQSNNQYNNQNQNNNQNNNQNQFNNQPQNAGQGNFGNNNNNNANNVVTTPQSQVDAIESFLDSI